MNMWVWMPKTSHTTSSDRGNIAIQFNLRVHRNNKLLSSNFFAACKTQSRHQNHAVFSRVRASMSSQLVIQPLSSTYLALQVSFLAVILPGLMSLLDGPQAVLVRQVSGDALTLVFVAAVLPLLLTLCFTSFLRLSNSVCRASIV